jgi:apolipoprotein N-acyltransferase
MQHLQISQMRALETGRTMLRATNTGMTAVINYRGEAEELAPEFTVATITRDVQGREGATPYVRFGNLPVIAFSLAMIALMCLIVFLRKKNKN